MNLDFTEISPDPATNYTWLNGQSPTTLTALTGARLSRQAAAGTPPSSTPSLPQPTAQASPAKLPSPSEQWAELADKLWNTVQQTARISGMLSQAVLRPNSSSLFTPTDVVIEGVMMHQSEETETGQWFETIAGEQISLSQVSSGYDLAVNELKALHLTVQANEERDNIIRFQLILNRNGVRFPLELPGEFSDCILRSCSII